MSNEALTHANTTTQIIQSVEHELNNNEFVETAQKAYDGIIYNFKGVIEALEKIREYRDYLADGKIKIQARFVPVNWSNYWPITGFDKYIDGFFY